MRLAMLIICAMTWHRARLWRNRQRLRHRLPNPLPDKTPPRCLSLNYSESNPLWRKQGMIRGPRMVRGHRNPPRL